MLAELPTLEARIQYRFTHTELVLRAFTHTSFANEARTGHGSPLDDNEQLEFLGDSVLGFLASEALVQRNPEFREGDLSRRKAHLVSAAHLYGVARRLDLGSFLQLGRSEEMSGGRAKKTLLVDSLEALIAAIYLDGGLDAARQFVSGHILDAPFAGDADAGTDVQPAIANFKSALQELAQSRKLPQPRYAIIRERGPEHAKTFTVEVRIGKEFSGQAEGRTKKVAAQRAARTVYERMMNPSTDDISAVPVTPDDPTSSTPAPASAGPAPENPPCPPSPAGPVSLCGAGCQPAADCQSAWPPAHRSRLTPAAPSAAPAFVGQASAARPVGPVSNRRRVCNPPSPPAHRSRPTHRPPATLRRARATR